MASIGGSGGEPEFQVAPMVDVLLVLLVFFMAITTAQVIKVDKTIKLPVAINGQKMESARSEVIVNVRWDSAHRKPHFVMDDRIYGKVEDLIPALKKAKEAAGHTSATDNRPVPRLVIRADRNAELAYVSQLMNAGGEIGITDISFSSVNKD